MDKTPAQKAFNYHRSIPLKQFFPIAYLMILGVLTSIVMFLLVNNWEEKNQHSEFESWAKAYSNAVESTLNEYVEAVLFLGDYFNNSPVTINRQQFNRLAGSLLPRYPGIQAFGWDPLVKHKDRSMVESMVRNEGFDDFRFTERSKKNELVEAAHRDEYVIVYYIHPLENNKPAFGYDIASNKTRLKAITSGFESGKLTATGRITLVQETGNQLGVLLLLPIYNQKAKINSVEDRLKNRIGFAVEVLRIGTVIETALKRFSDQGIALTLYDLTADEKNRFLYQRPHNANKTTDHTEKPMGPEANLFWSKTIHFAERQWKIEFYPDDNYYQANKLWQGWLVLFGSLLLTTLWAFHLLRGILHTAEIEHRVKIQAETNQQLKNEISERTLAEQERDKTINNLKHALDEVKTLRGILPICSFCKKVRDDEGYWEQVDVYIHKHSLADFSHGICPDCAKDHYPTFNLDEDEDEDT